MKNILISISMFLLLVGVSWAEDSALTISGMKVEPGAVSPGGTVLIFCQVNHSDGPMSIERVAATSFGEERNSSYPMLYDDGTNGDNQPDDGIYSLEITAGDTVGEERIVFIAVDTDKNEIESEAVILTVQ